MQEKLNYCPKWRESWTINFSIFFWGGGGGGFSSLPPTCRPKNVHSCRCGVSGGSSARRPGSQDPHRRERNLGHFFFLSCPVSILGKRLFVVFQNLAWAPKSQKILGFQPTKNPPPPLPTAPGFFTQLIEALEDEVQLELPKEYEFRFGLWDFHQWI